MRKKYKCYSCDGSFEARGVITTCESCKRSTLFIDNQIGPELRDNFLATLKGDDMWRYSLLLPVSEAHKSHLKVGMTPLYKVEKYREANLWIKDESRNPSGSLKDRATELVLAVAKSEGAEKIVTASTGNAAASLACIAAAQRLVAKIFVPKKTPFSKLAQVQAYAADLELVDGDYDDAFEAASFYALEEGAYNRSTGVNPFTREGKKTVAFEILEQLQWKSPDWIAVPTGDGNILSGVAKGLREIKEIGLIDRLPRLICAQASTSNFISRGYMMSGVRDQRLEPTASNPITRADSISVRTPKDYYGALDALEQTDGVCVELNEDEIFSGTKLAAQKFGVFCEPSAGAAMAAIDKLLDAAVIKENESVVVIITGSGLKDPGYLTEMRLQ
jgi:threonine synthase